MRASLPGAAGEIMKFAIKLLLKVIATILIIAGGGLLFLTLTAYSPEPQEEAITLFDRANESFTPQTLQITNWNIGYAGLGAESDFIMDGGVTSKVSSIDIVNNNLKGIEDFLLHQESDVYFIQELDRNSARSWNVEQANILDAAFPDYSAWFSYNHKAIFVPFPPTDPMGRTEAGLTTMTRYIPNETPERHQLPGDYSWPTNTVHLKRCAMITRIPSSTKGKDWCLINIHLSAYGDGTLRSQQLGYLKDWMMKLYGEGHYVVIGGDWNSLPPGIELDQFGTYTTPEELLFWIQRIPDDWTPAGWLWGNDPQNPTNRTLEKPFVRGENLESIIDGFVISPNVEIIDIQGWDLAFQNSDHNPITITVSEK